MFLNSFLFGVRHAENHLNALKPESGKRVLAFWPHLYGWGSRLIHKRTI